MNRKRIVIHVGTLLRAAMFSLALSITGSILFALNPENEWPIVIIAVITLIVWVAICYFHDKVVDRFAPKSQGREKRSRFNA